ncbi:MAG: hypothetical protein L3V56_05220 [Candidatus Magnetoovum sp. WYHC-5]|nr:hypothetical protein [Candidatus Magnetoovum sp. WYHC-5]
MPSRYEDVPDDVAKFVRETIDKFFSELINVKLKVLFDTRKRMSKGKPVIGRIQKTNDLTRHLTKNDVYDNEGYDYIIYLDKLIFTNIDEKDKERLIRRQLRHIFVDPENPKNPYKLLSFDVEDFYAELELNKDDIRWAERVMEVALALYDEDKENSQDAF